MNFAKVVVDVYVVIVVVVDVVVVVVVALTFQKLDHCICRTLKQFS